MLISLSWLREFVPYTGTAIELGDRLTMQGLELERIYNPFEAIEDIVVGHVLSCEKHPEADKLSVCTVSVNASEEPLNIVCGAPNIAKGQKVPIARVGVTMPDGMQIKKAKLRGVPSEGMVCSGRELLLSEEHDGILVLAEDAEIGKKLIDVLGLEREVLEIDITPNKADCLSILGIARETALGFNLAVKLPALNIQEENEKTTTCIEINTVDENICPLYSGRVIKDITVKASPDWLRYRLLAVGQRPINNIVDITNYLLLELGHPLHAFDKNKLAKNQINVAALSKDESFTTLDGIERKLLADDIVIRDGEKIIALAGVMGGQNSEITTESKDVFLECALFQSGKIRKTARRLALSSESSYRFERGVDQGNASYVLDRAAELLAQVSGGKILQEQVRKEPKPYIEKKVQFRIKKCESLLGISLTAEFCKKTLELLGCIVTEKDANTWEVLCPSHRLDLEREVDLFEEIARVYGMDKIAAKLPEITRTFEAKQAHDSRYGFIRKIKTWASGLGLHEVINYSFVGNADLDLLSEAKEGRVQIANPLSEDQGVMRTVLGAGLLKSLKENLSHENNSVRIFECARVFHEDETSDTQTKEEDHLGVLLHGSLVKRTYPAVTETADYAEIKGLVEHLFETFLLEVEVRYELSYDSKWLSPCVDVMIADKKIAYIGMVEASVADAHYAKKEVWIADINLDMLSTLCKLQKIQFKTLPVYPASSRDVTFECPFDLSQESIALFCKDANVALLEEVAIISEYIPEGGTARKLTYRMKYRHAERTLKDKEVDKAHQLLLSKMQEQFNLTF